MVATNAACKLFVLLACVVSFQITKAGNVALSKIFVGIQDHQNIFTQKFKTRKFYNTKISRFMVGHSRIDKLKYDCILPSIPVQSTGKMELQSKFEDGLTTLCMVAKYLLTRLV